MVKCHRTHEETANANKFLVGKFKNIDPFADVVLNLRATLT
jgi:hypothetical protein